MANFFLFCISSNHFRRQLKRTLCSKSQDKPGFQYQSNASTMNTNTQNNNRNSGNKSSPTRRVAASKQQQYQQMRGGSLAMENLRGGSHSQSAEGTSPTQATTPERSILNGAPAGRSRKHHSLDSSAMPVRTRRLQIGRASCRERV